MEAAFFADACEFAFAGESNDVPTVFVRLAVLQQKAVEHDGIDYLQVFESADGDRLWIIEDGPGGAITALLPDEY
jgi:hypothetical protein